MALNLIYFEIKYFRNYTNIKNNNVLENISTMFNSLKSEVMNKTIEEIG